MLLVQKTIDMFGYDPAYLTDGSGRKVCVECDYCGSQINKTYTNYIREKRRGDADANDRCRKCKHLDRDTGYYSNAHTDYRINEKYNMLRIICFSHYERRINKKGLASKAHYVYCICDCGREAIARLDHIVGGNTRSCGCLTNLFVPYGQLVNDIFVYSPAFRKGILYSNCICPKCQGHFTASNARIMAETIKSCGNCCLMRNGKHTSQSALDIDKIVSAKYTTEHNHRPENYKNIGWHHSSSIDIAIPDLKIAVEYDSHFYHRVISGDQSVRDKKKKDKLIDKGWKVLTIYGVSQIPTEREIFTSLDTLINTETKDMSVIMPDWIMAEKAYKRKYGKEKN